MCGCGQATKKQTGTVKENSVETRAIATVDRKVEDLAGEKNSVAGNNNRTYIHSKEEFLKRLTNGEKLYSFFSDNWTFIYHEDNRCDGSTNGEKSNLSNLEIDRIIKIKVVNDGDGWACEKKGSTEFYLNFRLKEQVKNWDRFEIIKYDEQEKNVVYVWGAGESDYLKLYYDDNNLIVKMEYRSEDPG
jgi:hypothetical protein